MPKLQDLRQTKLVSLPSYPDSSVEIYESLTVGDMDTIKYGEGISDISTMIEVLTRIIKKWNFTDEGGKDLPVTRENLNFLKLEDATFLFNEVGALFKDSKKKVGDSQDSQSSSDSPKGS